MKKGLTEHELEKQKKEELAIDTEYLQNVDGNDGVKFVADYETNKEKARQKDVNDIQSDLQGSGIITYLTKLAEYGLSKLEKLENIGSWKYYCVPTLHNKEMKIEGKVFKTQEGVQVILQSPKGKTFNRGIKTTNNPVYDVHAINILVDQAENTIDSAEGKLLSDKRSGVPGYKKNKSGLIVPD